ncbi:MULTISPECIES: flagellar motor protein MotB [Chromobacteriaceae]|uniref:Flagellar motor protein MotB n=2 Tax=Chromobacteriaceae TaxID=1499392 RepID=A0ABV0CDF4_9NEIS|nr:MULTISPECIES: flagellar motor protein MotB [Chromobacteriaceae]AVG17090.1 flagellar motor protein MotB [Chromobacterium vaccinii]ERE03375.1 flagellar motor protein MotB [Pseudogulbenkiania ferrooxidans EGD-HP2]
MADESQRPIIVKKIKKGGHGHHGGAWKIAYADFVTAMMAFFLLMWLLGSASQGTLSGISEYFKTPLKVAMSGGAGAGDATSVVKGGGNDLTKQAGQVNKAGAKQEEIMQKQKEQASLNQLQQKIQQTIDQSDLFKQYKNQLKLEMTPEGLKIQIVDEQNRPMFDSGSSRMLPHTRVLLQQLASELNQLPNRISISGHTDAKPFAGGQGGYSNWELSADRANTARRELVAGGLSENKILRVVGLSSANPLIKSDVFSPENRRITIVVLNKDAESSILNDGFKPQMNQEVIGGPQQGGEAAPQPNEP